MRRWFAIILIVISGLGSLVACCPADDCSDAALGIEAAAHDAAAHDDCLPLAACSGCYGCTVSCHCLSIGQPLAASLCHHSREPRVQPTQHSTSFWQPPRAA